MKKPFPHEFIEKRSSLRVRKLFAKSFLKNLKINSSKRLQKALLLLYLKQNERKNSKIALQEAIFVV